jgi:hypothetical protein
MAGKVYFGNTNFQTWIDAPQSGLKAASSGYSSVSNLLSGRSFVRRSYGASRTFSPSWVGPLNSTDLTTSLQVIKDFADGVYGSGNVYWLDPFAIDKNILPPHFASPGLANNDWPALNSTTPTFTTLAGTSNVYANNYPQVYATYTYSATAGGKYVDIIIPSGYYFHFGWHTPTAGVSGFSNPGFNIIKYSRATNLPVLTGSLPDFPNSLAAGGTTRTNYVTDGATYSRVRITWGTGGSGSTNFVAAIAQILPTNTPTTGVFIPGKGTTALQFSSGVEIEYYSSAINNGQIGLSTTLTEVD